ncbi:testis-specific serine/threonine-protein kinase 5-like [Talpa occidentalis]|uniref:testis-specific serine/threonine-protein kinase 5-like n=1 Tax=Talpa occidentalis TaxID=50954 RepID=UPI001890921A|nr:testis-specific serine/threonine-protein kinase 5-like [Talpa occidentalis]
MRGSSRQRPEQGTFMEQVRECRDRGYLLSSKKIGSGAFSKVYLAHATHERIQHNPRLASDLRGKRHTMVAIKIVSTANAPVEFSHKFLPREISSLNATYKHLNVVQLYETYQSSQHSYLVLELAARGDLLEHINAVSDRRHHPGLEEEEARRLFWQLVSAVAHCHSSGVVHRDLKCENILLDDQGFLKLTDFGFASRVRLKSAMLSTFCGSVAYTAPEILMSRKYNGEQADLWSLGVILYAMVTGKLPFKERQPHCMLRLMRCGPTFRPGLSSDCRDLIRGLLQLRPHSRLGLQQVAAHRWMLPSAHGLFRTVLRPAPEASGSPGWASEWTRSLAPNLHRQPETWCAAKKPAKGQLPGPCDDVEPGADSDSPGGLLGLRHPPQQDAPGESTSSPGRQGAGWAGPGALRQPPSLCSMSAIGSVPGHHLVN